MKANYHTHTTRCGHASGSDGAYVLAAIEQNFDILGFSDHVPWPYASTFRNPRVRMDVTQIEDYLSSVAKLRAKYRDKIRILTGFECEYFPAYLSWLAETKEEKGIDYLILGNHYDRSDENGMYFGRVHTPKELRLYVKDTVAGIESGLFVYLAHPDLFMRGGYPFDDDAKAACKDLIAACLEYKMPMEYNVHDRYLYNVTHRISYPSRDFFEMVMAAGVPVLIGIDAHDPDEISNPRQWDIAEAELGGYGHFLRHLPELTGAK